MPNPTDPPHPPADKSEPSSSTPAGPANDQTPEEPPAEELLKDTVLVEPEKGSETLLEACPSCKTLMDVTDQEPFAEIICPKCRDKLRARRQFNHFTLLELVGSGGMGHVFKAKDCNLNRMVALKVLRKELAQSPEERAKLETESRITASVNHPHVVKVYSFGQDHGQFYMAMELIERGSLDDLMAVQKRVAEVQLLEVGIQVAEGLAAALEHDLIHRDIKPGNILFSDPHTAKLVDFGLAIVLDEAAAVAGEIWGTPYYIAPEKLDNQPEDFRSDIYSLGATIFHALAGRPPYEADTASMVALKQLKSKPVSIQSFAPGVSSETAYVINRMLAKAPEDRYQSYQELIEHLNYAKNKLAERTLAPPHPKPRVVLETKETRHFTAILSIILILGVLVGGVLLYTFRDTIIPEEFRTSAVGTTPDSFRSAIKPAVEDLKRGRFDEARSNFEVLANQPEIEQPYLNWLRLNQMLADFLLSDPQSAREALLQIREDGLFSEDEEQIALADYFLRTSDIFLNREGPLGILPGSRFGSKREGFTPFSFLLAGAHEWGHASPASAKHYFQAFLRNIPQGDYAWMEGYQPLARELLADSTVLATLQKDLKKNPPDSPEGAEQIQRARNQLKTGQNGNAVLDVMLDTSHP